MCRTFEGNIGARIGVIDPKSLVFAEPRIPVWVDGPGGRLETPQGHWTRSYALSVAPDRVAASSDFLSMNDVDFYRVQQGR